MIAVRYGCCNRIAKAMYVNKRREDGEKTNFAVSVYWPRFPSRVITEIKRDQGEYRTYQIKRSTNCDGIVLEILKRRRKASKPNSTIDYTGT